MEEDINCPCSLCSSRVRTPPVCHHAQHPKVSSEMGFNWIYIYYPQSIQVHVHGHDTGTHPVARCLHEQGLVCAQNTAVHVQRHTMYVVCVYATSRLASMCRWLQRMTVTQLCLACTQQKCMADAASACVHVRHKSTCVLVSALSSPSYQDCWLWTNPADTEEQGQHSHKRW